MADPRPAGIGQVTPYLIVRGAARAIEFDRRAFEAVETVKIVDERDLVRPLELPADGLQTGKIEDPYGHVWLLTRFAGSGVGDEIG